MKPFKLFYLSSVLILFSSTLYGSDLDCTDNNRTEQGKGIIIDGICVDPPTLPYPDRPDCGEDSKLVQGNDSNCTSGTQAPDPGPYPPYPPIECPPGKALAQGTLDCAVNIPYADAGGDQNISICDPLTLDGNGSFYQDGSIIKYVWTHEGEILSEDQIFTLPISSRSPGDFNVTLTVTGSNDINDTDTITITINGDDDDYDFSYTIKDPTLPEAQIYLSKNNAKLITESTFKYWQPITGGTTEATTTPGTIDLHFNFSGVVELAHLFTGVYTFNYSPKSQGHAFIKASNNNTNWELLAEGTPPAYGGYTYAGYNDFISNTLIGNTDLYIRAELYAYGSSAPSGYTVTAQYLRHRISDNQTTFKLNVCYEQ